MSENKSAIIAWLSVLSLISFASLTLADDSRRTVFKVSKLSCGFCVSKIEAKLKTLEGYVGMLANIDKGLILVDHGPHPTEKEISEAITSIGYPARVASESDFDLEATITSDSPGWKNPSKGIVARILGFFSR